MRLFKSEGKSKHKIPLVQSPYNAESIKERQKKKDQVKKMIKNALAVTEGCLVVISILLFFAFWSSGSYTGTEWNRLPDRLTTHINTCATAVHERIVNNCSSIMKQLTGNAGRNATARISGGTGQAQIQFKDNMVLTSSAVTSLGGKIRNNYGSGLGLKEMITAFTGHLNSANYGAGQIYSSFNDNNETLIRHWAELGHMIKENWNKLMSFVMRK